MPSALLEQEHVRTRTLKVYDLVAKLPMIRYNFFRLIRPTQYKLQYSTLPDSIALGKINRPHAGRREHQKIDRVCSYVENLKVNSRSA